MKRSARIAQRQIRSGPSSTYADTPAKRRKVGEAAEETRKASTVEKPVEDDGKRLAEKKWQAWSAHATSSPFPDFPHPTPQECESAYRVLDDLHGAAVEEEFKDPETPETIPHVLDAIVVALLSQATSWNNAKRAMRSMKEVYGSVFAYDVIVPGGQQKLQDTIQCGGLHVRKSKLLMGVFAEVWERHGKWDLDHLFDKSNEDAMKEIMSYKGMGPKSAYVVMSWCLKRNPFTVDTHVYRIAGLWGWRPKDCTRELTQSHLDALVPQELKFKLHFLLIHHGRSCPACRGQRCEVRERIKSS
ncbi:uncharacterized protein LTR77_005107 [Saxophila tyrrhenica]|uniref:HhH-GPD domain-containing protein n=1 Tax=Saxophila tyrrhenica TaxID=1690608 RepID=A0AAV9PAX6_9PEZI|nr:hypothetical protein LTR77_005107 [Saxophila tyrrhenica]